MFLLSICCYSATYAVILSVVTQAADRRKIPITHFWVELGIFSPRPPSSFKAMLANLLQKGWEHTPLYKMIFTWTDGHTSGHLIW